MTWLQPNTRAANAACAWLQPMKLEYYLMAAFSFTSIISFLLLIIMLCGFEAVQELGS